MRRGGLAVVTIVFLGALARMLAPQAPAPAAVQPISAPASGAKDAGLIVAKGAATKFTGARYIYALAEIIRDFFGQDQSPDVVGQNLPCGPPNLDHWCVPKKDWGNIHFVIATVPDPVHTHLSLFFDRSMDSIGQGVSSQGYKFDRAVMPWHYLDAPSSGENEAQAELRESFPGLMIFRSETIPPSPPGLPKPPLFVFVVAETPTAGINKEQFHHALEMIHEIRQGAELPIAPEFGILGPTFSGSLYSLRVILNAYLTDSPYAAAYSKVRPLPVYATVMGTASIQSFQAQTSNHVRMTVFQEDATVILNALERFLFDGVHSLHYQITDLAVLNEDETSYGNLYPELPPDGKDTSGNLNSPHILALSFPRGISQFRSAYAKEFQTSSAPNDTANGNQPAQRNLRLDLSVTGNDDDSVAPYAKGQTALSQEGVMLAILSELRQHQPKFILLRATDPLDELFLARYFHDQYPQGRLVIPSPDLLFPRDEGGQLDGVLGINTYPLSPASMNPILNGVCKLPDGSDGDSLLFPAASGAALFNAASMIVFRLEESTPQQAPAKTSPIPPREALQKAPATGMPVPLDLGIPRESDSSCSMTPDLWLTIVNRNSIRPLKVLQTTNGSTFFPSSRADISNRRPQRTRTPPTWYFSYLACLILLCFHLRRSWTGGTLGRWLTPTQYNPAGQALQRKAWILWSGGILLIDIYVVLVSSNTPASDGSSCLATLGNVLLWLPLAGFVVVTSWDFWKRRNEYILCSLFLVLTVLSVTAGIRFALSTESEMILWQQRTLDLTSGISPATPLLLLLAGLYFCFWYSLRGESLVDWRSPQLPERSQLPNRYYRLTDSVDCIRKTIRPLSQLWWLHQDVVVFLTVLSLTTMSVAIGPGHTPIRSLEGRPFDVAYSILLGLSLSVLIAIFIRMIALWLEFRLLLDGLDRVGLKDALKRLNGFEWKTIWNPAWSVENEGYKLIAREIQTIERLIESLGPPADPNADPIAPLRTCISEILALRDLMIDISRRSDGCPTPSPNAAMLMPPFRRIQRKFAEAASLLCNLFLDKSWQHLPAECDALSSDDEKAKSSCAEIYVGTAVIKIGKAQVADPPPVDASGLSHISLRLAEEFVACVYSNFLVTVLLRVRGLVFSAVALYVLIVFSTISYPFQPAPELNTLAVALFLFGAAAIGYVYEEMHRDPTLSRMTSTDPGKLDSSFWVKFATAGIAPLVALASTVYPPFGHLLYTLVGPLLQALR